MAHRVVSALVAVAVAAGAAPAAAEEAACPEGNLLAGRRPIQRMDVSRSADLVTDGQVVPEGSQWNAAPAVILDTAAGSLTWDLGQVVSLRGVYAQADANDIYGFWTSVDGRDFKRIGDLPTAEGHGLRGRTLKLDALSARFLRFGEGQGDNSYSVSEVAAWCTLPEPFPPSFRIVDAPKAIEGPGLPWWHPKTWWTDVSSARWEGVLALLGCVLLVWGYLATRRGQGDTDRRLRDVLLGILGVLAAATYVNFGAFHFWNFVHRWDTFHYYVGAKYFHELGYDRLYECTAIADLEAGLGRRVELRKITNLRTNDLETTKEILADPGKCKNHFGHGRWEDFKRDIAYFRKGEGVKRWEDVQTDHGFNATPVWTIAGQALANLGPASDDQILLLNLIDPAYLVGMALMLVWAFGWRTAAVAMLVFATNFPNRYYWTGGSLLRQDWLFWTTAAVCFARKDKLMAAGFSVAYATLLRLFPGFLVLGPVLAAALALRDSWSKTRRLTLPRPLLALFGGGILGAAVLVSTSFAVVGGVDAYVAFKDNSAKHAKTPLTNYMGLRTVLVWRPSEVGRHLRSNDLQDPWSKWKAARLRAWNDPVSKVLYVAIALGFVALAAAAARRKPVWAMLSIGAALIPVAPSELTCYYYSFLIAVAVLHELRAEVGIVLLANAAYSQFVAAAPIPWMSTWFDEQYTNMSAATLLAIGAILIMLARDEPVVASVLRRLGRPLGALWQAIVGDGGDEAPAAAAKAPGGAAASPPTEPAAEGGAKPGGGAGKGAAKRNRATGKGAA